MNYKQQLMAGAGLMFSLGMVYGGFKSAVYYVEPGHRAFKFNKISGVGDNIVREGWHLKTPWFERQIIYDVRTKPREFINKTGTADLQMVNIGLRGLYRPEPSKLNEIYRYLGLDYDGRVLPSIVNEVLKAVIARYNAK